MKNEGIHNSWISYSVEPFCRPQTPLDGKELPEAVPPSKARMPQI